MLLLWLFVGDSMTLFRPPCLHRTPHDPAPLLWIDIPPSGGTKPDRLAADWRRREFAAREVEDLERQIDKNLRWQSAFAHQPAQECGASRAENLDPIAREIRDFHSL